MAYGDFENGFADKRLRPDGGEQFFFGNELARAADELIEDGVGFGPEFNYFWTTPQTFVRAVETEGIEDDAVFAAH